MKFNNIVKWWNVKCVSVCIRGHLKGCGQCSCCNSWVKILSFDSEIFKVINWVPVCLLFTISVSYLSKTLFFSSSLFFRCFFHSFLFLFLDVIRVIQSKTRNNWCSKTTRKELLSFPQPSLFPREDPILNK